jgi:competence protein ComEC
MHPGSAPVLAITLWVATAVLLVAVSRRRMPRAATDHRPSRLHGAALLVALATAAAATTHVALAAPAAAEAADAVIDGGHVISVEAIVTGKVERRSSGDVAFDALALRWGVGDGSDRGSTGEVAREGFAGALTIAVVMTAAEVNTRRLDVGARVVLRGTAARPFPGDRAAFILSASGEPIVAAAPTGALAVTADLRAGLVDAVASLPDPGRALIPGLAVGDTALVSPTLDTAMKSSSLSHLTAVSGANCALVVGIVHVLAAVLGLRRPARTVLSLLALGGFVMLVTPEPSVVRAGVMAAVAMIALLLGRTGIGLAVLSLAVAVLLVVDPWLSTSMGFALSVVATASLLVLAPPLARGLRRVMPASLALIIAVPLAAQLACGPLLVLLEPTVPLFGVVANILAAPAAPAATIVGLLACVAGVAPVLQAGLVALAWVPAAWIAAIAGAMSALPGAQLPWWEGPGGLGALAVVGGAVATLVVIPARRDRRGRLLRWAAGAVMAVVIGVTLGDSVVRTVAGPLTLPAEWSLLACDVGQGDAVLLRSAGQIALVDTGPDPVPLQRCLDRAGVDRVHLLVLTHFDLDHAGGIAAVEGRVDQVVHGPEEGDAAMQVLERLRRSGAHATEVAAGATGRLGESRWEVLWPRMSSRGFPPGNDASVVLDVSGGGLPTTLLLGDLSEAPQRALLGDGALRSHYDVVKVAHHGSADQHLGLYSHIDASVAVVTVGADNTHGHPRREILDPLAAAGTVVARTDTDGVVAVTVTGEGLRLWRAGSGVGDSR